MGAEQLGSAIAHEFHAVATLDQRQAFCDELLELNRSDFRSILLALARPLRDLVPVQLLLDAVDPAMEDIHD
jgi:hypothetical protein